MYPKAVSDEKRPGVIVFHGGGWVQSTKETTMNALCLPFLAQGFVVCNVEYRVARLGASPAEAPAASKYDAALAQRLGADERGMKSYVLAILTSGPKTDLPKEELTELFNGHMRNIGRLADEGKLVVAGPFAKNERNYRGIFVLNVTSTAEAEALLKTDPAVAAGVFAFEVYGWYGSAALQETLAIHERIDRSGH